MDIRYVRCLSGKRAANDRSRSLSKSCIPMTAFFSDHHQFFHSIYRLVDCIRVSVFLVNRSERIECVGKMMGILFFFSVSSFFGERENPNRVTGGTLVTIMMSRL